jgi:drug/metabolite transporter (DMT)-like permease
MHWSRILGIGLIVAGAIMLYMGWSASGSLTEEVSEALTGRYTEETRNYLIGGAVAAVVGLVLLVFGARR